MAMGDVLTAAKVLSPKKIYSCTTEIVRDASMKTMMNSYAKAHNDLHAARIKQS
jgi:hypothetical protein